MYGDLGLRMMGGTLQALVYGGVLIKNLGFSLVFMVFISTEERWSNRLEGLAIQAGASWSQSSCGVEERNLTIQNLQFPG